MVKFKSQKERDRESSSSGGCLSAIRPVHLVLLLCMVLVHFEIANKGRSTQTTTDLQQQQNDSPATTTTTTGSSASGAVFVTNSKGKRSVLEEKSKTTVTTDGCTPLQKRLMAKAIPDAKTIIDATKCPNSDKWLKRYFAVAPKDETFLVLNFGCNKGYDALFLAETVSRNVEIFNKQNWGQALGIPHPGNCNQGAAGSAEEHKFSPGLPQRQVEVHCIEAMPQTAEKLKAAAITTKAKDHGFHAHNYAMVGTPKAGTIPFPNPTGQAGLEHLGIAHCRNPQHKNDCLDVPTRTVDEFVAEHVDTKTTSPTRRRIPYMSVDVEGFDYTVLKGATQTLQRVDYLEFEYHAMGDWRQQKLQDAIVMLYGVGFICYWSGVNQLWKISTDTCWLDHFEFHQWSNVACVQPKYQPKLAHKMEQVFEDTLVEGKAVTT